MVWSIDSCHVVKDTILYQPLALNVPIYYLLPRDWCIRRKSCRSIVTLFKPITYFLTLFCNSPI